LTEEFWLAPLGRNKLVGVSCRRAEREFGHAGLELAVPRRAALSRDLAAEQGLTPIATRANEC
jgi:hypothetical protein